MTDLCAVSLVDEIWYRQCRQWLDTLPHRSKVWIPRETFERLGTILGLLGGPHRHEQPAYRAWKIYWKTVTIFPQDAPNRPVRR